MKINVNNAFIATTVGSPRQFVKDARPEIALSGRSNVGKSSLINTLLGRKALARVSSTPGKTITINYYDVDGKFYIVDLPGYGYAKRSLESKKSWSTLTESFFTDNPASDTIKLVIQLIDIRTGPTEDDVMMINWLLENDIRFTVVLTKTDKLSKTACIQATNKIRQEYFSELDDVEIIPFSSVTREGKDLLWRRMLSAISTKNDG